MEKISNIKKCLQIACIVLLSLVLIASAWYLYYTEIYLPINIDELLSIMGISKAKDLLLRTELIPDDNGSLIVFHFKKDHESFEKEPAPFQGGLSPIEKDWFKNNNLNPDSVRRLNSIVHLYTRIFGGHISQNPELIIVHINESDWDQLGVVVVMVYVQKLWELKG